MFIFTKTPLTSDGKGLLKLKKNMPITFNTTAKTTLTLNKENLELIIQLKLYFILSLYVY